MKTRTIEVLAETLIKLKCKSIW